MANDNPQWRVSVCLLWLFLAAVLVIGAQDLVSFTRRFFDIRSAWVPVEATVIETSIGAAERKSASTRNGAASHITVWTVSALVRYRVNGQSFAGLASGWPEYYKTFATLEQGAIVAGNSIMVRVDPNAPAKASLLGEWTRPSTIVFARMIALELIALAALIVAGKFAIKR